MNKEIGKSAVLRELCLNVLTVNSTLGIELIWAPASARALRLNLFYEQTEQISKHINHSSTRLPKIPAPLKRRILIYLYRLPHSCFPSVPTLIHFLLRQLVLQNVTSRIFRVFLSLFPISVAIPPTCSILYPYYCSIFACFPFLVPSCINEITFFFAPPKSCCF